MHQQNIDVIFELCTQQKYIHTVLFNVQMYSMLLYTFIKVTKTFFFWNAWVMNSPRNMAYFKKDFDKMVSWPLVKRYRLGRKCKRTIKSISCSQIQIKENSFFSHFINTPSIIIILVSHPKYTYKYTYKSLRRKRDG